MLTGHDQAGAVSSTSPDKDIYMPRPKKNPNSAATLGYEAQLWQMADALRGSMDAAEYKHVCLGLLFLKYISDAFEEKHAALVAEKDQGADPEDPDEYRAQGIFWVPPEARWPHLKAQARQSTVGQLVDDAMTGIERDNPALKGVLPAVKPCASSTAIRSWLASRRVSRTERPRSLTSFGTIRWAGDRPSTLSCTLSRHCRRNTLTASLAARSSGSSRFGAPVVGNAWRRNRSRTFEWPCRRDQ